MKARVLTLALIGLLAAGAGLGAAGCTVHAMPPAVVVQPEPVVVATPPPRVYYNGVWLHYRSDGYYYYRGGSWVVARSVPVHVARYHHPAHVRAVPHVRRAGPPPHAPARGYRTHHRRHHKVDWVKGAPELEVVYWTKPPTAA